jgi:hypothetical protein
MDYEAAFNDLRTFVRVERGAWCRAATAVRDN